MSRPFVAGTRYRDLDLVGTASADVYVGKSLRDLAGKASIPPDYDPVGIMCHLHEPGPKGQPLRDRVTFSLVAVKTDKGDMDAVDGEASGTAPRRFDLEGVTAEEVLGLVKRLEIKFISRELEDVQITECDDENGDYDN